MPPKKTQNKERTKSKGSEKCEHFNRGYCKFQNNCEKKHNDEVCKNIDCDEDKCEMRHPNPCKFGFRCRFNKKDKCLFSHDTSALDDIKLETLQRSFEDQFNGLETQITQMQKELKKQDSEIKRWKGKCDALVESVAKNEKLKDKLEGSVSKFESKIKEANNKIQLLNDKVKTLESTAKIGQKSNKCADCDFTATTEVGLKKHTKRMHNQALRNEKDETFPSTCTLCDHPIKSKLEMKRHMKSHTYKGIDFKCEECDFLGINETTMEVHFGKEHSENIECGLCEFLAKDQVDLDIHLSTCESYKCDACNFVTTTLASMKTHVKGP